MRPILLSYLFCLLVWAGPAVGLPKVNRSAPAAVESVQFISFDNGLPKSGQWRNGFDLIDMNGDGKIDLVHGPARKARNGIPHIFLGDGAGNWKSWQKAQFPSITYDYGDVAAGDLNRDGKTDLALAMHLRGVVALLGDGEGSFRLWSKGIEGLSESSTSDSPAPFSSRIIRIAELTGDQWPDLISLGEGLRLSLGKDSLGGKSSGPFGLKLYRSNGAETWTGSKFESKQLTYGDSLSLADFNGDTKADVLISTRVTGFRSLLYLSTPDSGWRQVDLDLPDEAVIWSVESSDLNSDGDEDIIYSFSRMHQEVWETGINLLHNDGSGNFKHEDLYSAPGRAIISALAIGDLDGNQQTDIVAADSKTGILLFSGKKGGGFDRINADLMLSPPLQGCRTYRLKLLDIDGDSRDEIFANFAGEPGQLSKLRGLSCPSSGAIRAWKLHSKNT